MQPYTKLAAQRIVQAQISQRLARVVVGFTAGNDAKAVVRSLNHVVVESVGPDVGHSRVPLGVKQACLLVQGGIWPPNVHTTWRHVEFGQHDIETVRVYNHGGTGLHDLLNRLHACPHSGKPTHGQAMQTKVQNFLHRRRKKHRCATRFKDMVALVGCG